MTVSGRNSGEARRALPSRTVVQCPRIYLPKSSPGITCRHLVSYDVRRHHAPRQHLSLMACFCTPFDSKRLIDDSSARRSTLADFPAHFPEIVGFTVTRMEGRTLLHPLLPITAHQPWAAS